MTPVASNGLEVTEDDPLGMQVGSGVGHGPRHFHLGRGRSFGGTPLLLPDIHAVLQCLIQPMEQDEVAFVWRKGLRYATRGPSMQLDDMPVVETDEQSSLIDNISGANKELPCVCGKFWPQTLQGKLGSAGS